MQLLGKLSTRSFVLLESVRRHVRSKASGTKPPRLVSDRCSANPGSRLERSFDSATVIVDFESIFVFILGVLVFRKLRPAQPYQLLAEGVGAA